MSKSLIGASLLFSEPNCPTREGELIKSLSDMENIPAPYLGMKVFVEDEGKCFFVSKLKEKVVDGVPVADAVVAELLPFGGDYTLPQATTETLGGVLLSEVIDNSNKVPTANAVKAELEKKQGVTKVVWENVTNLSNMNDFTTAGVYELSGEHTRINDNLPIANTGSGHTFNARLTVLDSSIPNTTNSDDKCITQLLNFNNRLGQAEIYIRTGKGKTIDSLTWDAWSTLQRNVNVGQVDKLDNLVDNGIYSGVYFHGSFPYVETFVMIVLNDYAAVSQMGGGSRSVSQFKYSYDTNTKETTFQHRTLSSDVWSNWENLGGSYTLPVATTDTLGGVKVYETKGKVSSGPSGAEYSVNIRPDGTLYTTVDHADKDHEGVVYVDNSVNPESNNPVSGKAVAEYVEDAIEQPIVQQTETTVEIAPNVLNVWGEVSSLDITLGEAKEGVINEYMFQFTSGATATTLVLPADIKWLSAPNIQANKTYQVSIINNLAVIGEFGDE